MKVLSLVNATVIRKLWNSKLIEAVHKEDYVKVQKLLKKGADPNILNTNRYIVTGFTFNVDIIKLLIDYGLNCSSKNDEGYSALTFLVKHFNTYGIPERIELAKEITQLLISNGADLFIRDQYGNSILEMAIEAGADIEIFKLLIKDRMDQKLASELLLFTCRESYWNDSGEHEYDFVVYAEYFIGQGADINAKRSDRTPIFYCAETGHLELAKCLIANGADIYAKDRDGNELIFFTVLVGFKEIVNCLLDHGVDINSRNTKGNTLLDVAQQDDIVQLLKKRGAKKASELN